MSDILRVCPHKNCAELNPVTATDCHACGVRLVPRTPEEVARHKRIRAAVGECAAGIDPEQVARNVISIVEAAERKPEAA